MNVLFGWLQSVVLFFVFLGLLWVAVLEWCDAVG